MPIAPIALPSGSRSAEASRVVGMVRAEAQQFGDRVVGLEDPALQVAHEHGVGGILDQALGVGAGSLRVIAGPVQLAHVAQDADRPDRLAVRVAQRRGVQGRRDGLPGCAPRVEHRVAGDAPLHDFLEGGHEVAGLLRADEAQQRLL
jgi:hypothetical protein